MEKVWYELRTKRISEAYNTLLTSNYRTFRGGGNFVTGAHWEAPNFTDETM